MIQSILQHISTAKLSSGLTALMLFVSISNTIAQNPEKFIRGGNKYYNEDNFGAAELKYTEALSEDPNSEKGLFNQGNAYYKQEKYEESLQNYEMVAELLMNPAEKAAAYHNLGNAHFKNQKFEESIEAYKNALRNNPIDGDTKYNLALAQKMLEQQQQQNQDQENQDQENQDQENQDQKDQEDKQDQGENEEEQQKDGEGEDEQDQSSESKDEGQEQDKKEGENQEDKQGEEKGEPKEMKEIQLTPEQVEQLLKALAQDENKVQEKLMKKKMPASPNKSDKDW